jgi:hypothetical protein
MKKLTICVCVFMMTIAVSLKTYSQTQPVNKWIYRVAPSISFATSHIANNDAGLGILGGVERSIYKNLSVGAETGFNYFIGDNSYSTDGKNKAYTIPVLAEMKLYFLSQFYVSPRVGAIYYLLNDEANGHVGLAYGLAGGFNVPKKNNRINIQTCYTSFRHGGVQRGYATLAAAIIIN